MARGTTTGVQLPLSGYERDLDVGHEGGIYVSIKESRRGIEGGQAAGGERDPNNAGESADLREAKRKRSNLGESTAGVRDTAVHDELGEIALLNEADQVQIYGEAHGRCWILRLKSDWQKENVKQRDQQLSVWLQVLRAKLVRPEDCAKAVMGISLDGNGIYAFISLHRATSFKSLSDTLHAATGIGGDAKTSAAIEIRAESAKNARAAAGLVETSTQSTFSFGLESRPEDRRKQKVDLFKDVDIQSGSMAEIAVLTSDVQYKATSIAWRPTGSRCLAVGCSRGVCLWHIKTDTNSGARQALGYGLDSGATEMVFLQCHGEVRAMSWSPCGRLLSVSLAKASSPLLIWEVSLGVHTKLSPGLTEGASHFLKWSPSGDYLLVATESGPFYIWETHTWTFKKWSFDHKMLDAVWVAQDPQSSIVLASFEGVKGCLQQVRLLSAPSLSSFEGQLPLPGVEEESSSTAEAGSEVKIKVSAGDGSTIIATLNLQLVPVVKVLSCTL